MALAYAKETRKGEFIAHFGAEGLELLEQALGEREVCPPDTKPAG